MAEVSTIARPYAKAAFEHAVAAGELSQWSQALALAAEVAANAEVNSLLDSPALSDEQKAAIFVDICGAEAGEGFKNFVTLLAENKRLSVISAISQAYEVLKAQQEQSVDVEVTSAFDLSAEQQQLLAQKLKDKWRKEISLSVTTDASLIGGVIIRAGDLVIDDSVRGKLTKIAETVGARG